MATLNVLKIGDPNTRNAKSEFLINIDFKRNLKISKPEAQS